MDRKTCDQCGSIMPAGDTFDLCLGCELGDDDAATIDTGGPQSWLLTEPQSGESDFG